MKHLAALLVVLLSLSSCNSTGKIKEYGIKVVAEYPHDSRSYTQGLFFHRDTLIESTGQYAHSTLSKIDLKTGKPLQTVKFARKYFGEGSVVLGDKLYVLTWTNNMLFVYDPDSFKFIKGYSYPREGWGITTDGKSLIASDGSSQLYFFDQNIRLQRTLKVKMDGKALRYLNELEYIDGKIWANVYMTDMIVIINPESGAVEGRIDCRGLLKDYLRSSDTDVLNGIAYNPSDGKIYLTGKNWPRLYEIKLVERR